MTSTQQAPLHPKTVSIYTNFVWDHFQHTPLTTNHAPQQLADIVQRFIHHQSVPDDNASSILGKRVKELADTMYDKELPLELETGQSISAKDCPQFRELILTVTQKWLDEFMALPLEEWEKRVERDQKKVEKGEEAAKLLREAQAKFYRPPTRRKDFNYANRILNELCRKYPEAWSIFKPYLPDDKIGKLDNHLFLSLTKAVLEDLFKNAQQAEFYLKLGVSLSQLASLEPYVRRLLFQNKPDVELLVEDGVDIISILSTPSPNKENILRHALVLHFLLIDYGIDFRFFIEKAGWERGDLFFQYAPILLQLVRKEIPYEFLVATTYPETLKWIFTNPSRFEKIASQASDDAKMVIFTFPHQTLEFMA
jgi:hypothetical protein